MHRLSEGKADPRLSCRTSQQHVRMGLGLCLHQLFWFGRAGVFLEHPLISKFHFRVDCTLVAEVSQEKRETSKSPSGSKASSVA